jgi:drug/metabolite transporter (DMT)-like permease
LDSQVHTNAHKWTGVIAALTAAVLFGTSTPLSKVFLPRMSPQLMAGLLYLSSGVGLGVYWFLRGRNERPDSEARLTAKDAPWLAGAFLAGGIAGPVLLLVGLKETPASSASLLLNLEGVFTALLAWFVFKEHFDVRIAAGMALIAGGGAVLAWNGQRIEGFPWGSLAIVGACLAWAIDNNLTRKVSASDPVQIAMLKGLVAGSVNTTLGLMLGGKLPHLPTLLATSLIGFFGYGVSVTLFILGLRHVGAARTGAYFSTAPFIGAILSILLFRDPITTPLLAAGALMAIGVWLHLTEHHEHWHRHEPLEHEHLHYHDEHHQHAHGPHDPLGEPHSHWHQHEPLEHSHPHQPDIHHRHEH